MADDISKWIARFIEPFRVSRASSVKLARDFDPGFKAGIEKKEDGVDHFRAGIELLTQYQARLAAEDTYDVSVVLHALDPTRALLNRTEHVTRHHTNRREPGLFDKHLRRTK